MPIDPKFATKPTDQLSDFEVKLRIMIALEKIAASAPAAADKKAD